MRAFWYKNNYNISIIENDAQITINDPNVEIIEVPEDHRHAIAYYNGEFYYRFVYVSWQEVREIRNNNLKGTDFTQLLDYNKPDRQKWAEYRQKLRDLPTQFSKPEEVVFPLDPTIP